MKLQKLTPEAVDGKVVVVRTDYNVPLKNGVVVETTRIEESIPTLKFLLENGAKKIHILTHVGRPGGEVVPELSTKQILPSLEKFLGAAVEFRPDYSSGTERVQLHENCRFYPGEKKNDPLLAEEIFKNLHPDIFVLDGFGVAHRGQASVIGLADKVPCYPGFLLEKEIEALSPFLSQEKIPGLTILTGGVKMETKIPVLMHFARTAENILIGGALANTFQVAKGFGIGASLYEEEFVETAREVLAEAEKHRTGVHLPIDVVCADDLESTEAIDVPLEDVSGDMKIFDIGPHTVASFSEILMHSRNIIWNGPLGVIEKKPFAQGTYRMLEVIRKCKSTKTILGGGDTLKALKKWNVAPSEFSHVSTGGGAMLEFLAGDTLPGIEILKSERAGK
ncbi:phosphoglycerate kinase [Candidatus Gracilibacteria bacterium]|nr:phosphoglycerate kinase [Candidatus Gracilibacteria bacterium]